MKRMTVKNMSKMMVIMYLVVAISIRELGSRKCYGEITVIKYRP